MYLCITFVPWMEDGRCLVRLEKKKKIHQCLAPSPAASQEEGSGTEHHGLISACVVNFSGPTG